MKLMKSFRWALIAASIVSGPALAAVINCDVTPRTSVIADGQTLQLSASCTGGLLSSISLMNGTTNVSGSVDMTNHAVGEAVTFTTPVGLAISGATFHVTGVPVNTGDTVTSTDATVVVKSAGSTAATTSGFTTAPVDASCGTANNTTVSSLPSNGALCPAATSKPALVVSAPTSYSWSCLSLTGGAEANCYATRGVTWTVTTSVISGTGTISPSQPVNGGSSVTVTANPGSNNTTWGGTCGGTPNGNTSYTTNAVTQGCTVTASFTTAPAAVNGSCGSSSGGTFSSAPNTNLCSAGTASSVSTLTSSYTWSCAGSNGGTTANCSATRTTTPPTSGGSADPGTGSWKPSANRLIADQSGTTYTTYAVGCLNGGTATSSSNGCAINTTFDDFSMGSGNVLGVRYTSKSTLSNNVRYVRINSGDGGNLGQTMKAWLSTDPLSSYENTTGKCRWTSSTTLYATTAASGTTYCVIQPNTRYYLLMSVDAAPPSTGGYRYKLDELAADFN